MLIAAPTLTAGAFLGGGVRVYGGLQIKTRVMPTWRFGYSSLKCLQCNVFGPEVRARCLKPGRWCVFMGGGAGVR